MSTLTNQIYNGKLYVFILQLRKTVLSISESSDFDDPDPQQRGDGGVCCTLLYSLCPALTLLCALLLVSQLYSGCRKQGKATLFILKGPFVEGETSRENGISNNSYMNVLTLALNLILLP